MHRTVRDVPPPPQLRQGAKAMLGSGNLSAPIPPRPAVSSIFTRLDSVALADPPSSRSVPSGPHKKFCGISRSFASAHT
jgi:hypothetical protein